MSPQASRAILVAMAVCASFAAQAAGSKHVRLLSISFRVPFSLEVEGARTAEVFAKNAANCTSQCLPIVMAWECRISSEPICSELNRLPPKDLCGRALPKSIGHSSLLRETRWDCGKVNDSDGTSQVGFSVFDLPDGQLVVSYLGAETDSSPTQFFDFVAESIRSR
jgi:hypothetical protein